MRVNKNAVRRILVNGEQRTTMPTSAMIAKTTTQITAGSRSVLQGRSVDFVEENVDLAMQTAATPNVSSSIGPRDIYSGILDGFMATGAGQDKRGAEAGNDSPLYSIFRDIYASDPVCGSAVDLMSNMPFSDFSLAGAKDDKGLRPFEESIDNMKMRSLFATLSTEYLVNGMFCATTIFDEDKKIYTGLVPQNVDYVQITPLPIFGQDPLITLMLGDALKDLTSSKDERVIEYLKNLPPAYRNDEKAKEIKPDPKDVIYITRNNLIKDVRGVSLYRRVLTAWLMEKTMYKGTLDQAFKRQRAIAHMTVTQSEDWTPTQAEMEQLASMLMAADLDPVGAVFVTREGVSVEEIRAGDAFWKVTDLEQWFTQAKLRALGISESFLSGESTFNSLEQVLSVYVEQMRAYREKITQEVFYDRMFPRLARENMLTQKKHGLNMVLSDYQNANQLSLFGDQTPELPAGYSAIPFMHTAAETSSRYVTLANRDLLIPQIHWHKRLRPEADQAYLDMLSTLSEKGLPIPIRLWAAAGGLDLKSLVNQKDEDMELRDNLSDWTKAITKATMPDDGSGGGFGGGAPDEQLSMLTASKLKPKSLLSRGGDKAMEEMSARNIGGDGKRHLLSKRGANYLEEKMNKRIAESAASVAQQVNRLETRIEEMQRANRAKKWYT
jgi:hypothetical protein